MSQSDEPQPTTRTTLDQLEELLLDLVDQLRQGRLDEVLRALPAAGTMIDGLAALPQPQLRRQGEQLARIAVLHDSLHMALAAHRQDISGRLAGTRRGKAVLDVYRRSAGGFGSPGH